MEELLKAQTKVKELENSLSSLKITTKALEKLNSDNDERNIEVNSQLLKLSIENERSLRDANTTK